MSVNPGGPLLGSGMMYFTGNFDGKNFTADARQYPIWMDYGMDNYAGVTFSNIADRTILIGWMNNWEYADKVPCDPWRSAMTLPRELKLVKKAGEPFLANVPVKELSGAAFAACENGKTWTKGGAYELVIENFDLTADQTITLKNQYDNQYVIRYEKVSNRFVALRNEKAGRCTFHNNFNQDISASFAAVENQTTVRIIIDQSSVELFAADGTVCMTNLVFPVSIYNACTTTSGKAKVRVLNRVW